ncbi:MAG: hypothetical protein ACP5UH_00265 [Candidatus Micrarchaeia archaeon]
MQAWLECNDLFIRAKNALYGRALDLFDEELKEGNIAVNGKFVKFEENGMQGRNEYLMLNMLQNKDDIADFFEKNQKDAGEKLVNRVSAFIEKINTIERLVALSKVFDEWAEEALLMVKEDSAEALVRKGIDEQPIRNDAIAALLDIEVSAKEGDRSLSNDEVALLESTISYRRGTA